MEALRARLESLHNGTGLISVPLSTALQNRERLVALEKLVGAMAGDLALMKRWTDAAPHLPREGEATA